MELEYYKVTSELDAREVLRYLNYLGIRNISGEVLKYFISDLKKLIKYDLQQKENLLHEREIKSQGPERLHSATTFSSRSRSKANDGILMCCSKECTNPKVKLITRKTHSAPCIPKKLETNNKPLRRACSCVRVEKKTEEDCKEKAPTIGSSHSKNLIKVPKQPTKKKCDPVSLYHYYTSLWAKYKPNVPGENDWSELRWRVRQKMAGNLENPVQNS
ncbi:uncharacterized protein LOC106132309 [Amyelois transitella]|uniref:uncharacterized protein LOC106132309 n=1 Tax=Amyelois transitella TaxID=680683 RepID=UPI00067E1645|nr:uncharacterized protein LOC106132309 [Amyelois transitella]